MASSAAAPPLALDTNVLAYAEGAGDQARLAAARGLVARLPASRVVVPAQVLGELFRVLVGKRGQPPALARTNVLRWADLYIVRESTWAAMQAAFDLSAAHGLAIWDALILSVAAEQNCRVLLSEDLQPGFTCRGVTVVNPFVEPVHPLLQDFLT
jgi:predicted nucleic acid-binding protein